MFLLDEHMSPEIVPIARTLNARFAVISLHGWCDGLLIGQNDERILREAAREKLTLVTFDVNTIPPLLQEMARAGEDHAGVVFVSSKSFAQNDSAGIAAALLRLWLASRRRDWTNRVVFLSKQHLA
ncbi:MAG: DUF5615 family PIN-like protein [Verrucomicrobiae bacterium]